MNKTIIAAVVFSLGATFRRAGIGFTNKGTAFLEEHLTEEQRVAIDAEPRLSVKEMPVEDIPDGVDTTLVDAALAIIATEAEKAAAAKTKPAANAPPKKTALKADVDAGKAESDAGKA